MPRYTANANNMKNANAVFTNSIFNMKRTASEKSRKREPNSQTSCTY